ncbi:MAG: hypothetical protein WCJ97_11560 [Phycisphaerae bacterium]
MKDATTTPTHTPGSSATLGMEPDTDILCINCTYNLRGLSPDGRCPECGQPVAHTLRDWPTLFALGPLEHRFSQGLLYSLISLPLALLTIWYAAWVIDDGSSTASQFGLWGLGFCIALSIEYILWITGVWRLTLQPQYGPRRTWLQPTARFLASISCLWALLLFAIVAPRVLGLVFGIGWIEVPDGEIHIGLQIGIMLLTALLALFRLLTCGVLALWMIKLNRRKQTTGSSFYRRRGIIYLLLVLCSLPLLILGLMCAIDEEFIIYVIAYLLLLMVLTAILLSVYLIWLWRRSRTLKPPV